MCWPFPLQGNHGETEDQPCLLPPLDEPKIRRRCCQTCQQEIASEGSDADNHGEFHSSCCTGCDKSVSNGFSNTAVRSDVQQQLASASDTVGYRAIDLNSPTNLICGDDCLWTNNGKEDKVEVVNNRMIGELTAQFHEYYGQSFTPYACGLIFSIIPSDHETGVEGKLNHRISSVPPPEVDPWLMLKEPTNDKGKLQLYSMHSYQLIV